MKTPLPGAHLNDANGREVFAEFLRRFRANTPIVNNVPTHCDFVNLYSLFWGHVFDSEWIADDASVYYIEEGGWMQHYPQDIRMAAMREVRDHLKRRPLEGSIDTYILDTAFSWCIVITHDDICRLGMPVEALGEGSGRNPGTTH